MYKRKSSQGFTPWLFLLVEIESKIEKPLNSYNCD